MESTGTLRQWSANGSFSHPTTISLVSRDPSFCCGSRTVEINTPLESVWSTKLIFVAFDCNRAIFDEQEQVIDSEARSVNRFL